MNVHGIIPAASKGIIRHGPTILTIVGALGVVSTAIFASKVAPKAQELWQQFKEDIEDGSYDDRLTMVKEFVQIFGPLYAVTLISGGVSIACILSANRIHLQRQGLMVAAYTLSEKALKQYQEKVLETFGKKKTMELKDAIAEDKMNKNTFNGTPIVTVYGDTLCLDTMSGRYFLSDISHVRKAENELIKKLNGEMYVSLNDFYDLLGLPETKMGGCLGWDLNEMYPDITFSAQLTDEGNPCMVIDYITCVLPVNQRLM